MNQKRFFTAAFVLASALAPALAAAAPMDGYATSVAVVRTSDVDLSSLHGQSTLDARNTALAVARTREGEVLV